ncbi:hypothetical protein LC048_10110 [Mesobacillus subterraneus]|nr:hypothetical protein [Mesobacillus subterraneus]WLR57175.1 hypothetical protein LC048_10110 [Mesobacillus subterraneus]
MVGSSPEIRPPEKQIVRTEATRGARRWSWTILEGEFILLQ